ncbi:NAD(P)/FAD-dependent oxidoreductase [Winogradskyella undariae]|uniref:phytoene desaturase family protein n=1 Tax=Winogradskyella undariae TaxID=1285465 RepID=UPI00156B74CB|nr:NAD(P)/FAD-dependent oxidoreductase [Winogradskyella undariae]NRR89946.1 NAD(P)/FAD-dependent oxidoreductase [Winogradskyella undariae]
MSTTKNNTPQITYDTIIIGSGVGGLSAAICLARAGQKVLVLEQHDVPGGWCHSFYLNGYRFTPGVHYVGLLDKGQSTSELYEGLGIANDIAFYKMNPKAYEHCHIGKERFDYPSNFEDLKAALIELFPHEKKGIIKYLTLVKNVGRQLQLIPKIKGLWQQITIPFRTKHMGKYAPFSLKRVVNWHVKDPLLQSILNVQFGDHGLPPSKASFVMHAAIMDHYSAGGYYPMGGGGSLVKAMTNKIKKYHGVVQTSTSVKQILLEGSHTKKAIGVELESGEQLFAKRIISNADPGITYSKLIGETHLSKKLLKKLNGTKYSCTSIMLFLTVDMDVKNAGLDSGNIWLLSDQDLDKVYNDSQKIDLLEDEEFPGMFISCTTLKDPVSFDGKYHTIEAITYINYDAFAAFKDETEKRSPAYLEFKEAIIQKFLKSIEKVVPGITSNIVHQELGTPITNEYYINATKGNVYGTEKSLKHIGPFAYKMKTEIENLYMCGSSTLSHGVAGAGYSGVQTAAVILGCKQDDLIQADSSQNLRVYDAEDNSNYPNWMLKKIVLKKSKLASKDVFTNLENS